MIPGISVVVPTVAPRAAMLRECLRSIADQTLAPDTIIVQKDVNREGAAVTRQKGTNRVDTDTVAFLDDDDVLYPQHLERLHATMQETGADIVYPWYDCPAGDPLASHEGVPFNSDDPRLFPVTFLGRSEAIRAAGGWRGMEGTVASQEDWALILNLVKIGAKIVHLPVRSWLWNHHGSNSSGRPENIRW
jgi:glycosyltransferase involved in cell wall biosynthesis